MTDPAIITAAMTEAMKLGKQVTAIHAIEGMRPTIVAPQGYTLLPLEKDNKDKIERPRFLVAHPGFNEVGGFIAYVNTFKDRATRLFYQLDGTFLAVIDYHEPLVFPSAQEGAPAQVQPLGARHGDHCATLKLLRSPEWEAWANSTGKQMGQIEFAEFIEDNAADVVDPEVGVMMAVATGLAASTTGTFRQAHSLANGTVQVQWDEQINGSVAGRDFAIPTEFTIGVRPFMGCNRYQVGCRFRYRARGGELKLFYKALRMDWVTETALEGIVARVRDETGIAPALGNGNVAELAKGK